MANLPLETVEKAVRDCREYDPVVFRSAPVDSYRTLLNWRDDPTLVKPPEVERLIHQAVLEFQHLAKYL